MNVCHFICTRVYVCRSLPGLHMSVDRFFILCTPATHARTYYTQCSNHFNSISLSPGGCCFAPAAHLFVLRKPNVFLKIFHTQKWTLLQCFRRFFLKWRSFVRGRSALLLGRCNLVRQMLKFTNFYTTKHRVM